MKLTITNIAGIADAIMALKFSKRSYTEEFDQNIRRALRDVSDPITGAILPGKQYTSPDEYTIITEWLQKLAKYGAGVMDSTAIDAGHDTLLRFIDFTVVVQSLHRGAQDDLDAHAMRMENRIVRASTRLGLNDSCRAKSSQRSEWYSDKILTYDEYLSDELGAEDFNSVLPPKIVHNGISYVRITDGYIQEQYLDNDDVRRGLYRLSMASDCIFKINLYNARHLYKRRNKYKKASPELQIAIESFADQASEMLPWLGGLVRYDWAHRPGLDEYTHISNIHKEITR